MRTIGVPASRGVGFSWRGQRVTSQDVVVFPLGADLSSVSTPDFHVYTCSFPEELLAGVSESLSAGGLDELRRDATVLRCPAPALESVRRRLRRLCATIRGGNPRDEQDLLQLATHDLPARLLGAIAASHGAHAPTTTSRRQRALFRAEAYVERHARESISVQDVCRAAQVSQRTLEYAFMERFGLSPKAFLTAHRLNAARRELRAAQPATHKVADIANGWGFWHLGQFAADYREQFGELPSHTLRRGNG